MIQIPLYRETFTENPRILAATGRMTATGFRFSTGVEGIKIENSRGHIVMLPFQGQQIWRACFDGHDLTMRTAFDEPVPTRDYLATYGGFFLHCGFTAMGGPGPGDTHAQHGELPNIPYDSAALLVSDDAMTLAGVCRYKIAFTVDYTFRPAVTLGAGETVLDIDVDAQNNRASPMEYMYLAHLNFRPTDGGELVYSAPYDTAHIKVHRDIPAHMDPAAQARLEAYMDTIERDPSAHHVFDPALQCYNPEVCMTVLYDADAQGFGHTMQALPDGYAQYIAHEPGKLPYVIRWLSRTGSEDSCGMALPATAEHHGRNRARADGQLKTLGAGETFRTRIRAGLLTPQDAREVRARIEVR